MDQLMQAMNMFADASEKYGIASGIKEATEHVEKITNDTVMDVNQKYAAQRQLANQLQARLSSLGASGQQIASAVGAIAPPDVTTVAGAKQYAAQATVPADRLEANRLVESNVKAAGAEKLAVEEPLMTEKNKFEADEKKKDRDLQWNIALLSSTQKKKEAKSGEVSFETNLAQAGEFVNELKGAVTRNGTWEADWGPLSDSKDGAILKQTPYKLAITYAKIVDPDSVAREGEVAAAQKYLIELGATKNKKAVLAQIDLMASTINQYKKNRGSASGKPFNVADIPTGDQAGKAPVKLIKVKLNGKTGQISESQWDAFKAKNPNATRD